MTTRRALLAAAVAAVALLGVARPGPALAETATPFTTAAFDAAKAEGKSILVEISAPWCPTCKAQKPILADIKGKPDFGPLVIMEVDFDSQKDVVRALGAQMQSTLIAFKGTTETGRSVGDTDPASIEALARSAL